MKSLDIVKDSEFTVEEMGFEAKRKA